MRTEAVQSFARKSTEAERPIASHAIVPQIEFGRVSPFPVNCAKSGNVCNAPFFSCGEFYLKMIAAVELDCMYIGDRFYPAGEHSRFDGVRGHWLTCI